MTLARSIGTGTGRDGRPVPALESIRSALKRLGEFRAAIPITALGVAVITTAAVAWVLAARYGWDEAAVVAAGALLLAALSLPFLFRRGSFSARLDAEPIRVIEGDPSLGSITICNEGSIRSLPQRAEVLLGDQLVRFDVPSLSPNGTFEQPVLVPTTRRAVVRVGPVTMVKGDPIGLVRRDGVLAEELTVYVQPRRVNLSPVSTGWVRDVDGPTFDNSPRGDIAFHTIREYVPGDDLRHVHWKSTAKTGTVMVRQYVDNRRPELTIVIDETAGSYAAPEEFEIAIRIAASIEVAAARAGQRVTHHRGLRHAASQRVDDLLDDLAAASITERDTLLAATNRALTFDAAATVAVVITGSEVRPAPFLRSTRMLERSMRTVSIRVTPGSSSVRESNAGVAMTVTSVEEFGRFWQGVCAR